MKNKTILLQDVLVPLADTKTTEERRILPTLYKIWETFYSIKYEPYKGLCNHFIFLFNFISEYSFWLEFILLYILRKFWLIICAPVFLHYSISFFVINLSVILSPPVFPHIPYPCIFLGPGTCLEYIKHGCLQVRFIVTHFISTIFSLFLYLFIINSFLFYSILFASYASNKSLT